MPTNMIGFNKTEVNWISFTYNRKKSSTSIVVDGTLHITAWREANFFYQLEYTIFCWSGSFLNICNSCLLFRAFLVF